LEFITIQQQQKKRINWLDKRYFIC
jgi:hypothetical protein